MNNLVYEESDTKIEGQTNTDSQAYSNDENSYEKGFLLKGGSPNETIVNLVLRLQGEIKEQRDISLAQEDRIALLEGGINSRASIGQQSVQDVFLVNNRPHQSLRLSHGSRMTNGVSSLRLYEQNKESKLSPDVYSLMMVSKCLTAPWNIGFLVWIFQISMYFLIVNDQLLRYIVNNIPFKLPAIVSPIVSVSQVLALIVTNWMQDDIFVTFAVYTKLSANGAWEYFCSTLLQPEEKDLFESKKLWWKRVIFPSTLKFLQGFLGVLITVSVVLQNATIIELFKDLTALIFIGELDELVFTLAGMNHFGRTIQSCVYQVSDFVIRTNVASGQDGINENKQGKRRRIMPFYRIAQICSMIIMLALWGCVTALQLSGVFIKLEYPNCKFENNTFKEWSKLGDGKCDSAYNKALCEFDGGDCDAYNRMYPNCDSDLPYKVGDGDCDVKYNTTACRFDGYDCFNEWFGDNCTVKNLELLGDGKCDGGIYNTLPCAFDAGDCQLFNDNYPECDVPEPELVGNGICNPGEALNTNVEPNEYEFFRLFLNNPSSFVSRQCNIDGGDCLGKIYPDCDLTSLMNPSWVGNGYCNRDGGENEYDTKDCGFDAGDCRAFDEQYLDFQENYPKCNVTVPQLLFDRRCLVEDILCSSDGFPVCPGYTPDQFCDGHGDCYLTNFCDCSIGQAICQSGVNFCSGEYSINEYISEECGMDNNACTIFNQKLVDFKYRFPNCDVVVDTFNVLGNGICNSEYNSNECNWDDGDCNEFNQQYPSCNVDIPAYIGDNYCNLGDYNTENCGWDGGDCAIFNQKLVDFKYRFPTCDVVVDTFNVLGNGICNSEYNTNACNWDDGDCNEFNQQYPSCNVDIPAYIGDNYCDEGDYNTENCGWDGGDCLHVNDFFNRFPNCDVDFSSYLFDGECMVNTVQEWLDYYDIDFLNNITDVYNSTECGYDNGDCL